MSDATTTPAAGTGNTTPAEGVKQEQQTQQAQGEPKQGEPKTLVTEEPKQGQKEPQGTQGEPKTSAPAEIQIKVPQGFASDDPVISKLTEIAKGEKFSSEQAQKFVDFYAEQMNGLRQQQIERVTKWAEETKADKEIGGANLQTSIAEAKRALRLLGSPELSQALDATGLGNHKAVISFLVKAAKLVKEDALPGGQKAASGQPGAINYDAIYPTMKKTS